MVMKSVLDFIKKRAIDLTEMGVNNFALKKSDALKLIEKFKEANILLYGGDFIINKDGKMEYNYVNWSTNDDDIDYNLEYAKKFIEKYATDNTYIEFVTKEDLYKLFKK